MGLITSKRNLEFGTAVNDYEGEFPSFTLFEWDNLKKRWGKTIQKI
jgi:hypothetical protein